MTEKQKYQEMGGVLNVICPMHAILDASGHIVHAGPTTAKLLPKDAEQGARFLEVLN